MTTTLNVTTTTNNKIFDPNFIYRTKLEVIDLDKECMNDIVSGNGFFVEEPQSIKKDLKSDSSIFSSKFGTLAGETDAFVDRYRCECGAKRNRINHGIICDICHTPVRYVDDNFEYFGWCCLKDKYHYIHPNLFKILEQLIGVTRLDSIIRGDEEKDEDGFTKRRKKEDSKLMEEPYYQIGMLKFYEKFDEIIEFYANKYPGKRKYYDRLIEERDKVFTHCVPVYTTHLRPVRVEGENLVFEGTNAIYNMIAKIVFAINRDNLAVFKKNKLKKTLLYQLQKKIMELYVEIEAILAKKKGIIRNLFGGRYNFTSRAVIVSDPTLRVDQIKLSYHILVNVMQQTIINIIRKTYNVNLSTAYDIWYKARLEVNPRIVEIIRNLINASPQGIPFIINRNPSINYGSILQMYCVDMAFNYTMALPLQILSPLAGDFDGDCLNIWYLTNKEYIARCERSFNPRNAMYISNNDGLFNNDMNHSKDTLITGNSIIFMTRDRYSPEELAQIKNVKEYAKRSD